MTFGNSRVLFANLSTYHSSNYSLEGGGAFENSKLGFSLGRIIISTGMGPVGAFEIKFPALLKLVKQFPNEQLPNRQVPFGDFKTDACQLFECP